MMEIKETQDLYKVTRAQTEHIDNTLSQRIVWLVLTQSFFFSAYAVVITANHDTAFLPGKQGLLSVLLPVVALIMIAISYLDIVAGILYISKLTKFFNNKAAAENSSPLTYPPIGGFEHLSFYKNLSSLIVPCIFFITWLVILFSK
jgi:hypothetical protein